jgi:hypothetical protein
MPLPFTHEGKWFGLLSQTRKKKETRKKKGMSNLVTISFIGDKFFCSSKFLTNFEEKRKTCCEEIGVNASGPQPPSTGPQSVRKTQSLKHKFIVACMVLFAVSFMVCTSPAGGHHQPHRA